MKTARILLVAVLTLGLMAAWLATVDLRAMGTALASASPGWILVAAAGSVVHLLVRAWRWGILLGEGAGAARYADLVRYTLLGYTVTFVIPGRAGEIVRPALLWRRAGGPFGRAVGSVVLERVLDMAALGVSLGLFVLLEPERSPPNLRTAVGVILGVGLAGLLALALLARSTSLPLERLVDALAGILPRRLGEPIGRFGHSLIEGVRGGLRRGNLLAVAGLSVLTWTPVALTSYAGFRALGIEAPFSAVLALVPITAVGIAVPTPAGVGGFHAAVTWGLVHLFGASEPAAAASAVATHAASVLPVIVLGLYACWREGLSPSALRSQAASAPPMESAVP